MAGPSREAPPMPFRLFHAVVAVLCKREPHAVLVAFGCFVVFRKIGAALAWHDRDVVVGVSSVVFLIAATITGNGFLVSASDVARRERSAALGLKIFLPV